MRSVVALGLVQRNEQQLDLRVVDRDLSRLVRRSPGLVQPPCCRQDLADLIAAVEQERPLLRQARNAANRQFRSRGQDIRKLAELFSGNGALQSLEKFLAALVGSFVLY